MCEENGESQVVRVDNEFYRKELEGKRQMNGMEIVMKGKVKWRKGKWTLNSSFWDKIGENNDGRAREVLQKHIILNTDHPLVFLNTAFR